MEVKAQNPTGCGLALQLHVKHFSCSVLLVINREQDMSAVMTPVATPRAKDPLKTPRKMPKDFSRAMASKLWLLSPAGWYATMELL